MNPQKGGAGRALPEAPAAEAAESALGRVRAGEPFAPRRTDGDVPRARFRRGKSKPQGVRWFGATSFWGHLRHFVASAVATEDIDSRDWMTPDEPAELCRRVAAVVGGREREKEASRGASLAERLGRDVWIDYVSDTGDDTDVSSAVAALLVREYVLPEVGPSTLHGNSTAGGARAGHIVAPRGDILFFGGDTAYPVATAEEIHDRVVAPFNRVLLERHDGRDRVLMGIPGNHDWYDGLDGFARLFRRRPYEQLPAAAGTLYNTLQRGELARYTEFAKRFVRGEHVDKPGTLDLVGYRPVQSASYFVLPLAPGLHLHAVDRQLRSLDYRQRQFFESWRLRHPGTQRVIALPDPPYHFAEENVSGRRMLQALGLVEGKERSLVLSGDIHHYERWREGETSYVIAGGGGAFLHPAPVARRAARREVEWPGPEQSRRLLWQVPWKIAAGRSGVLPHFVFAALLAPIVHFLNTGDLRTGLLATGVAFLAIALTLALIGGLRRRKGVLLPLLAASSAVLSLSGPWLGQGLWVLSTGGSFFDSAGDIGLLGFLALLVASSVGASAIFGSYLTMLTWLGLENTQAFTALDHPGFKHFLRLRVRADGSGIDVWCLGLLDPLAPGEEPVVVDAFFWRAR